MNFMKIVFALIICGAMIAMGLGGLAGIWEAMQENKKNRSSISDSNEK